MAFNFLELALTFRVQVVQKEAFKISLSESEEGVNFKGYFQRHQILFFGRIVDVFWGKQAVN